MKYISFLIILFSINSFSEDYKSANRLKGGDVISAEVFNDILDRIELSLKTTTEEDFIGSWDVVQTTCAKGALGNCESSTLSGASTAVDDLYRQRQDVVNFKDDGDGTYSFQTENYCSFVRTHFPAVDNLPCTKRFAVVDENFIIKDDGDRFAAYRLNKISDTRFVLSMNANASASFNIIRLDKKNLPPNPPSALSASLSGSSVSLSWTASEGGATSYTVKAKTSATGSYSDVVTNNSGTTYTDTLSSGTKWYRVFAVNSDGTSVGSNVVSVSR